MPNADTCSLPLILSFLVDFCAVVEVNDTFQHLSMECGDSRLLLWRVQDTTVLIVAVQAAAPKTDYMPHIEEALEIIEQGQLLLCNALRVLLSHH